MSIGTDKTHEVEKTLRGWEALEEKLKARGLSPVEIEQANRSFHAGIDALTRMFLISFPTEKEK
jgi:hypothetical protein